MLVPDMAFCIDFHRYQELICPQTERVLLFKRVDKERTETDDIVPKEFGGILDVRDWIGYETTSDELEKLKDLIAAGKYREADEYAVSTYLPKRVEDGIRMISPYKCIYSNRLHGAILSVLLGKDLTIIDNSYGKNAQYYDTWMKGAQTIHIHRVQQPHNYKRQFRLYVNWICAQLGFKL